MSDSLRTLIHESQELTEELWINVCRRKCIDQRLRELVEKHESDLKDLLTSGNMDSLMLVGRPGRLPADAHPRVAGAHRGALDPRLPPVVHRSAAEGDR